MTERETALRRWLLGWFTSDEWENDDDAHKFQQNKRKQTKNYSHLGSNTANIFVCEHCLSNEFAGGGDKILKKLKKKLFNKKIERQ